MTSADGRKKNSLRDSFGHRVLQAPDTFAGQVADLNHYMATCMTWPQASLQTRIEPVVAGTPPLPALLPAAPAVEALFEQT